MNVLVVDVGNTRVKWRIVGVDDAGTIDQPDAAGTTVAGGSAPAAPGAGRPAGTVPLAGTAALVADWRALAATPVVTAFVSNVAAAECAEQVRTAMRDAWPDVDVRIVVAQRAQCGVVNDYRDASQLGPDRWLALVAAHALEAARPVLVCSFGTATTIDLLIPDGVTGGSTARFVGGVIVPGVDAMRDALASRTARLPRSTGDVVDFATSTDDAIASGVVAAQIGAVAQALARARTRTGTANAGADIACLFSGGGAADVAAHASRFAALGAGVGVRVIPDLVLRGLAAVASATLVAERRLAAAPT